MITDPFELSERFPAAFRYLIELFLYEREKAQVAPSAIARNLGVTPAAVTQSLHRLEQNQIITRHPVRGFSLTEAGLELARRVIARHYLVERMLVDTLDVPWDVADQEAEYLQRSLTTRMEEILCERLGHPQICPHGNPFPGSPREAEILSAPPISTVAAGSTVRLVRVTERGEVVPGLLSFCVDHQMRIGDALLVLAKDGDFLPVTHGGDRRVDIPRKFTPYICVSP